jgi:SAM-dependent methyltransferase
MSEELRHTLFKHYYAGQDCISSGAIYKDIRYAWPYYEVNYRKHIEPLSRDGRILEVGCGFGSLLSWLSHLGFCHLEGIDASPGDVAFANKHLGNEIVLLGDGLSYLQNRHGIYDCIIMKAVLEHIPKKNLLPFIEAIAQALNSGGIAFFDVPNMDWISASHERYMDLTHEVGFTRESLMRLLVLKFEKIDIYGSNPHSLTLTQRWFRRPLVSLLRRFFYIIGEGASDILFESRAIIAIARQPRLPLK